MLSLCSLKYVLNKINVLIFYLIYLITFGFLHIFMSRAKINYNHKVITLLHVLLKKRYILFIVKKEIRSLCLYIIIIPSL